MKNLLKISTIIIICVITFATLSQKHIFAQEETTTAKLYVSKSCKYCEALLLDLEKNDLIQSVTVIEVSEEPFLSEFRSVVENCNLRSAVPVLFENEVCYQGEESVKTQIILSQGLDPSDYADDLDLNQTENNEDLDQTSINLDEDISPTATSEVPEDPKDELNESENSQNSNGNYNLSDKLFGSKEGRKPPDVPTINIIVMLIAPAVLIGLGYYIITKMKV